MSRDRAEFLPVAANVGEARRFVLSALANAGFADLTIDAALLVVSELATNAVKHAGTPFMVAFTLDRESVTIEVSDSSTAQPVPREPSTDGGRGLQVVATLAADWGVREDKDGKTVFFRLDR